MSRLGHTAKPSTEKIKRHHFTSTRRLIVTLFVAYCVVFLVTNLLYFKGVSSILVIFKKANNDANLFEPINCNEILKSHDAATDDDKNIIHKKLTEDNFWISLHSQDADPVRWSIMKYGKNYESKITEHFHEILSGEKNHNKENNNVVVIDVGMNIGWYSLFSASYNNTSVYSFEPNLMHHVRMCQSLSLNGWNNNNDAEDTTNNQNNNRTIEQYKSAIGGQRGEFILTYKPNKPGKAKIQKTTMIAGPLLVDGNIRQKIDIITLDEFAKHKGWLSSSSDNYENHNNQKQQQRQAQSPPHISILKIDVESFEFQVFRGASHLLQTKFIKNIFCELTVKPSDKRRSVVERIATILYDSGYYLKHAMNWQGTPLELTKRWGDKNLTYPLYEESGTYVEELVEMIFTYRKYEKGVNTWWALMND